MRPKFFPASVLPVLAGSAWGFMVAGQFDVFAFVLALLATVCVHAGANVLNDVGDDSGGTDRQNEDRIYPYTGGSRFIQAGIMSPSGMARLGISLLGVAAIAGLILLISKGTMVLWFGIAGVLLAVLYSLGPVRLASIGLGELAVGIAFGVLPVTGAAWLQSGALGLDVLLFSIPVSVWVTAILLINEVPDVAADGATGKGTLPVRFGLGSTSVFYFLLHLTGVAALAWLALRGGMPAWTVIVPALLLVLALQAARAIRVGIADRPAMTRAIEMTLGIHTIGSIWLTVCALFIAFFSA
ncbi:MAG: 1,4-dihydroxy-2-naphthoate octaprenyltransferase [Gammaproteobacteria bacterium]|jgi:1,4-dihydroxy-2-naphthoate octaprenyltransferase|nr:1,4-dihydroxy-2-naphthoate octaprenyltransferase [Gammaproteobacteria bacterium]